MTNFGKKIVITLIIVLALVGLVRHAPVSQKVSQIVNFYLPCSNAIKYDIGVIDPRFKIDEAYALRALMKAEKIWENGTDRNLFEYNQDSGMTVNFLYDSRQEMTDKLKVLEGEIDSSKGTYNSLKRVYDDVWSRYREAQLAYKAALEEYNDARDLYDLEVKKWNKSGGAPEEIYKQLKETESVLRGEAVKLNAMRTDVNDLVKQVNSSANKLNRMAEKMNLNVTKYNTIGSSEGEEFTEGIFKREGFKSTIEIYQFSDEDQLVRVLAHELGHALGLDHVDSEEAIMFKSNSDKSQELNEGDLAEFHKVCRS